MVQAGETSSLKGQDGSTTFPNRLRQWRELEDVTLDEASDATGLSISALSRIERGLRGVPFRTKKRIARGLGVPIRDLFDVDEVPDDEVA